MKPLSKHIKETLNNEPLKEAFKDKFIEEELDSLTRLTPATKAEKKETKSFLDTAVGKS
jgi:hypothetical protein